MKFYLGILCGLILGAISATTYLASAQLAPFDAPLKERLDGDRAEEYLRMERLLERAEQDLYAPRYRDPCPR